MAKVQVITDSTADMPEGTADELGIRIVPIYVRFGEKTYRDGVDITKNDFYEMLASVPEHPATSQPNPEDFTSVFKEYCTGVEGIVSIHLEYDQGIGWYLFADLLVFHQISVKLS